MDLTFGPELEAFREEVREFFATALPADIRERVERGVPLAKEDIVRWQRILHEKGWIAPHWPKEYGGCGWDAARQYIFHVEMGLAGAPRPIPFGLNMVGPVIYTFGTPEQKAYHLPRILRSEIWWAQGFSEPGAGSDLAALATSARREGDEYVINGTKLWTTMAHWADWIFLLVRTSREEKRQQGITFLLVDMRSPGITVSPIITIDGFHHVNEVRFSDVRVPVANRVGEEGRGWSIAKFLLAHERQAIADIGAKKRMLGRLRRLLENLKEGERPLIDDPVWRRRLARLEADVLALEFTELRFLDLQMRGQARGIEPSILKVRGTELQQALSECAMDVLGRYALAYPESYGEDRRNMPEIGPEGTAGFIQHFLFSRAATIYGGSNEIQRNILAKMLLAA